MEVDRENNNTKKSTLGDRTHTYRNLLNRVEGLEEREDVGRQTAVDLGDIVKQLNDLDGQCPFRERVERAEETVLDAMVLSSASNILVKCIRNINITNSVYEPTEFAAKLLNELNNSEEEFTTKSWLNVLEDARKVVPEMPNYSFLYGTFDPTKIPEKKQRKERKKDSLEVVQKKQLQRIDNADKDEEGVDDTVNFLGNVLTREYEKANLKPINYFDFIIDSKSFATTVENAFYCSFLVRDGKAIFNIDGDGIPTLQPQRKRNLKAFRTSGGVNTQMMASISMDEWEVLCSKEGYIQKHKKQTGHDP